VKLADWVLLGSTKPAGSWSAICYPTFVLFAIHSLHSEGKAYRADRSLRHELPSFAQTLRSWLRTPLDAWMSVRVYSACVILCVGRGFASG
jgi:hypothetical protein